MGFKKNRRPCYLARYTAKFFQGTKVKLNCTFFSIAREKYLGPGWWGCNEL